MDFQSTIDLMPGFTSIIDLNLKYLAMNKKLIDLFKVDPELINGMPISHKCVDHREKMIKLLDSPIGTEINWDCFYNDVCLVVCSRREKDFIFSQAIDITEKVQSSQRNITILRNISKTVKKAENRRSTQELELLINSLMDNPIVSEQAKVSENLIKLEVELRENSSRINQVEKILFMDQYSLLSRIKELEIYQANDHRLWKEFDNNKEAMDNFSNIARIITSIPGGWKSLILIFVALQMLGIMVIDLGIRVFNLDNIIPVYIQKREANK